MMMHRILLLILLGNTCVQLLAETPKEHNGDPRLAVYLDCWYCDETYLRSTFTEIDYVRDRKIAHVQIVSTSVGSASGGRTYTFRFLGVKPFNEDLDFELSLPMQPGTTREERRVAIAAVIKSGLSPFQSNFEHADIAADSTAAVNQPAKDPWDFWVFSISSNIQVEREQLRSEVGLNNELSIRRITEEWRIQFWAEHDYQRTEVDTGDGGFVSTLNNYTLWGRAVKSLGPHFSVGASASNWKNSIRNTRRGQRFGGAVEYSVFPYAEVYKRELTIAYWTGVYNFLYDEVTLFDRISETRPYQSIVARYNLVQPWGNVRFQAEGFTYLHDVSKNRLELYARMSNRLVKGLFLDTEFGLNLVHDQLYLPRGDASLEEVLLNRQQLATNFEYGFEIGLSYVFGSIYNNIINTRL